MKGNGVTGELAGETNKPFDFVLGDKIPKLEGENIKSKVCSISCDNCPLDTLATYWLRR